jgi:hypothetical protein
MFVNGSEQNEQSLKKTFHRCFLPSFGSFGQAVSEEKILKIGQSTCVIRILFSSPCQRQCELLPSLGVRRPLTFHILIFSSETP